MRTATRDFWTRRARPENLFVSIEFHRFTGNPRWSECVIRVLSHGLCCRDIIQCLNWDEYLVTLGDVWSAWSAQGFPQQQRRMRLVSVRPSAVSCFSWKSFRVQAGSYCNGLDLALLATLPSIFCGKRSFKADSVPVKVNRASGLCTNFPIRWCGKIIRLRNFLIE